MVHLWVISRSLLKFRGCSVYCDGHITVGKMAASEDVCDVELPGPETQPFSLWKSGKPLNSDVKTIVLNVFTKLQHENADLRVDELTHACSQLTGVSENSIYKLRREYQKEGKFTTPGKERPRHVSRLTLLCQRYDGAVFCTVRNIIYDFYRRKELPSLSKVATAMKDDPSLPKISQATIHRLLKDIGFSYLKRKRNSILVERDDVVMCRRKYLRKMQEFRKKNRKIYYIDETWISTFNGNNGKKQGASSAKTPSGKAATFKLIIMHAGSSDGFVSGAADIFQAQHQVGGELMDGSRFETWFETKLLPNIPPGSVIVMDNVSYHSEKLMPLPTTTCSKGEIRKWLTERNVLWRPDQLRPELLQLVKRVAPKWSMSRADSLAELYDHTILCLPPYHSELNPIEEAWPLIKNCVGSEEGTLDISTATTLAEEALAKVMPQQWSSFVEHVLAKEAQLWEIDGLIEDVVERALAAAYAEHSSESEAEGKGAKFDKDTVDALSDKWKSIRKQATKSIP